MSSKSAVSQEVPSYQISRMTNIKNENKKKKIAISKRRDDAMKKYLDEIFVYEL